jgi:hypothetical protein
MEKIIKEQSNIALDIIANGLFLLCSRKNINIKYIDFLKQTLLPYHITTIGEYVLPLSRNYKPIGQFTGIWADYEKYPYLFIKKSSLNIENLFQDNDFFYNDGCALRTKKEINSYKEKIYDCFSFYNMEGVVESCLKFFKEDTSLRNNRIVFKFLKDIFDNAIQDFSQQPVG